jgi:glycosyltransferase involved in cell wall biosynthesis
MDVFVCPSSQENLPNTIAESLSCGVPAVAFDIGGIPDLIEHRRTGYLARPFDTADLSNGIVECLDPGRNCELAAAARAFALLELNGAAIASRHRTVYELALADGSGELASA